MSQQQGRVTDNLANIIQRIQLEHRTGELHVKRLDGQTIEQGSITFIDGRAVRAQLGSYQDATAFNILCTWKQCIFIFATQSSGSYQLPSPSQKIPLPPNNTAPNSGSLDRFSPTQTAPLKDYPQSQTSPLNNLSSSGTYSLPSQNSPISRPEWTQPLEGFPSSARNTSASPESDKQRSIHPLTSSIPLTVVPRATMSVVKAIGLINKAALPRTCRQILLLIDGQHSVNEIIIMANMPSEETIKALNALEKLSVITISK